ncbi:kinase-like domain-containing protein [Syncephalis plumigaleata]|nr:kinase-like domain-containing protein [Syncephalis plumigaleata]
MMIVSSHINRLFILVFIIVALNCINLIKATPYGFTPVTTKQEGDFNFAKYPEFQRAGLYNVMLIGYGDESVFGRGRLTDATYENEDVIVKCVNYSSSSSRERKMYDLLDKYIAKSYGRLFLRTTNYVRRLKSLTIPTAECFVTQYVNGVNLVEYMQQVPLENKPAILTSIMKQVATTLGFYHTAGFTHNDVTPSNIIVDDNQGNPKATLIDVDLGRALSYKKLQFKKKKPLALSLYMPPEAFLDAKISLVYAEHWQMGICIYEVIYGKQPFEFILNDPAVKDIMSNYRKTGILGIDFSLSLKMQMHYKEIQNEMMLLLSLVPHMRYRSSFFTLSSNKVNSN